MEYHMKYTTTCQLLLTTCQLLLTTCVSFVLDNVSVVVDTMLVDIHSIFHSIPHFTLYSFPEKLFEGYPPNVKTA